MTDLYATLGVARDADRDTIKRAYRKAAKAHHPDTGGDTDAFRVLQHAWDVLSDPARRAKYDAMGDDTQTPDPEAQQRAQIMSIVHMIIAGVLETSKDDPRSTDYRARILRDLAQKHQAMRYDLDANKRKTQRTLQFVGRFKTDGDDLIGDVINAGLRDLETGKKNIEEAIALHERVTQVFIGYQYQMDEVDPYTAEEQTHGIGATRYLGRP